MKDDKNVRQFLINMSYVKTKLFYAIESYFRITISVEKDSHVTCRKCYNWVEDSYKKRKAIKINRAEFRKCVVVEVGTTTKKTTRR